jgi:hypothetical protein
VDGEIMASDQTAQQAMDTSTPISTESKDFNKLVTTPFFSVDGLDRFRPYYTALEQHDTNTATIILTQKSTYVDGTSNPTDYFSNFKNKVSPLLTDSKQSVGGSIVDMKSLADDKSGRFFGVFRNFSLIQYNEVREEIAKIALNFGAKWNAYFFGAKPRVYNFGGFFLDSKNYPYYEQFMRAYDNYLSGSRCVSGGFRMYMAYDGKITSGWMLGINTQATADNLYAKSFTFQLLVDDENWFRTNYTYDINGDIEDGNASGMSNIHQIPGIAK